MMYTGDPLRDFEEYDAECEKVRLSMPVCDECREHIFGTYYDLEGHIICEKCMEFMATFSDDISCDFCKSEDDKHYIVSGDIYCTECMDKFRKETE